MSTSVVLSDLFGRAYNNLDGSLKSRVMDFVVKLQRDPTATGLDLKRPAGVADRRVRTARVNDSWRAVLLALPAAAGYVLVAVQPHDDAYAYAASLAASVNEVTGALEILDTDRLDTALRRAGPTESVSTARLLSAVRKRDLLRLGVQEETADRLLAITDEDTLLTVADALPRSQGEAVLDLYCGLSPDEVWANLVDEPAGAVDTDDLIAALARPLSQLSFTDLAGEDGIEELRAVLEGVAGRVASVAASPAAPARHARRVERPVPRDGWGRHGQDRDRPTSRPPPRAARRGPGAPHDVHPQPCRDAASAARPAGGAEYRGQRRRPQPGRPGAARAAIQRRGPRAGRPGAPGQRLRPAGGAAVGGGPQAGRRRLDPELPAG